MVRAAIYHARARRCAPPQLAAPRPIGRQDGRRSPDRPAPGGAGDRARPARSRGTNRSSPWSSQTPRGIWTVEARLLYDLQKVCVDHEREIYTVDLVEWALSWGRRPIKRRLPSQRDVLMLKHLRSAARRLAVVRISDEQRRQLAGLLHDAIVRRRVAAPPAAAAEDRRRAGRGRPDAAEPARAGGPKEAGRGTARSDRASAASCRWATCATRFRATT